jgi:hemoglobin
MIRRYHAWTVVALASVLLIAGCHSSSTSTAVEPAAGAAAATPTLYDRLGGATGVHAVVDRFAANLQADTRINHYFADTDFEPFKASLANLIEQTAGGPQKYTGRDMKTTHAGLGITGADFDALIEDLSRALDQQSVGEREKNELLAALMPLRKDIVEK